MDVVLVMFSPTGERRDFPVKGKKTVIGRTTESDIQIQLEVVSRQHCELKIKEDALFVRDKGSSNGTYVNNKRIQESSLHAGDTLTVGPVTFTVVIDGEPAEITPVPTDPEAAPEKVAKSKSAKSAKPKPQPKPIISDDSGSIDLNQATGSGVIELEDEDAPASDPLAALEELAKQKRG